MSGRGLYLVHPQKESRLPRSYVFLKCLTFFPFKLKTSTTTKKNRRRSGQRRRPPARLVPRLRRRLGGPPRAPAARFPFLGRGAGRDEHQDGADADGVMRSEERRRERRERSWRERSEKQNYAIKKCSARFQSSSVFFFCCFFSFLKKLTLRVRARVVW